MISHTLVPLAPSVYECLSRFADIPKKLDLPLAGQAGSGRKYYRIELAGRSWVLQQSHSQDADFTRFVEYCGVFSVLGLPTPHIHAFDSQEWQVLLDDLGTTQLWDHCKANDTMIEGAPRAESCADLYARVLTELTRWQNASRAAFQSCADLRSRHFDTHALRWETEYFSEHYLQGLRSLPSEVLNAFHPWFDDLATRVANHPRGLMHRDFQSQNVMVDEAGRIGFVDFQGAREGSLYYDAASLLWDPYIELDPYVVQRWFNEWVMTNPNLVGDNALHWPRFLEASLQRLMQALGAFCNLSRNKGITSFAKHIAPGEKKLKHVLALFLDVFEGKDATHAKELLRILESH